MKRRVPKVTLNRETLRQLDAAELKEAAGGFTTGTICCSTICPTHTCHSVCYKC